MIKLTKIKDKDKTLKATMEKQQITYGNSQVELWDTAILWLVTGSPGKLSAPRTPLRILADFSTKFYKPEGNGTIYLK